MLVDGALHNGNTIINSDLQVIKQTKFTCTAGNTLHTFTHQQSHSTIAIQREGRNENVEKGEEKVYSVMDDIFSNMERLNNVPKRESVELDLKS